MITGGGTRGGIAAPAWPSGDDRDIRSAVAELISLDAEPATDPTILEKLDHFRARAEAGEISSIAIAVVTRDGSINGSWSNKPPSLPLLLGSLAQLGHRLSGWIDR